MFGTERPVQVRELALIFRTRSFFGACLFFAEKIEPSSERAPSRRGKAGRRPASARETPGGSKQDVWDRKAGSSPGVGFDFLGHACFLGVSFFCGKIELLAECVRLWSHAGGGHRKGAHASAEAECKRNGGTTGRGGMNGVNGAAETPKKLFVSNSIFFV